MMTNPTILAIVAGIMAHGRGASQGGALQRSPRTTKYTHAVKMGDRPKAGWRAEARKRRFRRLEKRRRANRRALRPQ